MSFKGILQKHKLCSSTLELGKLRVSICQDAALGQNIMFAFTARRNGKALESMSRRIQHFFSDEIAKT